MSTFNLKIITPNGIKFNQEVSSIETSTVKGRIGLYANHVNLIGQLVPNVINLKLKNGQKESYIITKGYLFFENNIAKIITNQLYEKDKINLQDLQKDLHQWENDLLHLNNESALYKLLVQKIKEQELLIKFLTNH